MSSTRHLALLDVPRPMREWTPDPSGEIGEVFTRRWVVDLMLDLVGYSPDTDLATKVASNHLVVAGHLC